jgi:hypothetical protein
VPASPDELDELIEELTVDCYNEDEQLTGFLTALDEELTAPVAATVVGTPIEVLQSITTATLFMDWSRAAVRARPRTPSPRSTSSWLTAPA